MAIGIRLENTILPQLLPARLPRTLAILWAASMVLGLIGLAMRLLRGHADAGYGSYVPWGLWVGLYFHGVGIAGGAFLIGSIGYVFNITGFADKKDLRTDIVLSAAAILSGFMGVGFDLGHMDRAHYIFTSPSFTSMMAYNAWMYNAFIVLAGFCWLLTFLPKTEWLKPLLFLGILFSFLFPSQSGAFFAVVVTNSYWHNPLLIFLFLTSAITVGTAALALLRWYVSEGTAADDRSLLILRWITLGGVCFYFLLEFGELALHFWNPQSHEPAIDMLLTGPYWWMFWLVHLAGGLAAFILLAWPKQTAWMWGSLLVVLTFISGRLNILIPGQSAAELEGLQEAYQHARLTYLYFPTRSEERRGGKACRCRWSPYH